MTWLPLVRAEIRKLTTTKMPWGFLAMLVVIGGLDAAVAAFGTDMDGSKAFVATAADQQALMAFAFNAMLGTALFGTIAAAREYGHGTVVPTLLTCPRRSRAVLAQLAAVLLAGAVLALVGQALMIAAVALALRSTEYGLMVSAGDITQLLAASALAGAIGAVLGAGLWQLWRRRWLPTEESPSAVNLVTSRTVAAQLNQERGATFAGHQVQDADLRVSLERAQQRRASRARSSQVLPGSAGWSRLKLLADTQSLRWLRLPGGAAGRPAASH